MSWLWHRLARQPIESTEATMDVDANTELSKQAQPWVSRGLKGVAKILYRETTESEIFITAGGSALGNYKPGQLGAMTFKIPSIPIVKNVLAVTLPHAGFAITVSKQIPGNGSPVLPKFSWRNFVLCQKPKQVLQLAGPAVRCQLQDDGFSSHRHIVECRTVPNKPSVVPIKSSEGLLATSQEESTPLGLLNVAGVDGLSSEPFIEDVDDYVDQLNRQSLSAHMQTRDRNEPTIVQLENRMDELASAKNNFKAQRDEANIRVKQLTEFLEVVDPSRTKASMQREINELEEELEYAHLETEIECDAKNRNENKAEARDIFWKAEILKMETRHSKEMGNEKKLRKEAKERLQAQHEAMIEQLNRKIDELESEQSYTAPAPDEQKQADTMVLLMEHEDLEKDLYDRLKLIEKSLKKLRLPSSWQDVKTLFAHAMILKKKIFENEDYKDVCERARILCPHIAQQQDREYEASLKLVVYKTSKSVKTDSSKSDAAEASSADNTFKPNMVPSFDFSNEQPTLFQFGSSPPAEATSTGTSPTSKHSSSGFQFSASSGSNSPASSQHEGSTSSSSSPDTASSEPFPFNNPFSNSTFPTFGSDTQARSKNRKQPSTSPPQACTASVPIPEANPFVETDFSTFGGSASKPKSQRKNPSFASSSPSPQQPPALPSRKAFDPFAHSQTPEVSMDDSESIFMFSHGSSIPPNPPQNPSTEQQTHQNPGRGVSTPLENPFGPAFKGLNCATTNPFEALPGVSGTKGAAFGAGTKVGTSPLLHGGKSRKQAGGKRRR